MTPLDVVFMILAYAVILLLCLPVHEFAHGIVAYWCCDNTAKWHGRLSLNPFRHLDLWGTIMILTVGMGYAKPVPVVPRNFRNYKRDMILVALAGPLSNFLMAAIATFLYLLVAYTATYSTVIQMVLMLLSIIINVNISLMVFNLLPIPPLDGSRLWSSLLPGKWAYTLEQYSRYITIGLFVLLFTGVLDMPLYYLRSGVTNLLFGMFSWMFI
jgi:Zn-dependent protease